MSDSSRVRPGAPPKSGSPPVAASLWLLYPLLAVVFLRDAVFSGGAYLLRDILTFFHPWQTAVRESLRAGALPFWNHDTSCGIPLLANLQSGVFYPPNWLYLFLSFDHALTIGMVLHLALAAIFLRAFLRRTGVEEPAAFLGGALFAFGTWPMAQLEAPMKLGAAVWLPLAWLGTWDAMREGRRRGLGFAGLAIGLSLLAGYPQITALALVSVALLAVLLGIELLFSKEVPLPRAKRLRAAGCARCCCSPAYSWRRPAMTPPPARSSPIPPTSRWRARCRRGLIRLLILLSRIRGRPLLGGDAVEFPYGAIYVGTLGLLLAVASIPAFRRLRRAKAAPEIFEARRDGDRAARIPTFLIVGTLAGVALAPGAGEARGPPARVPARVRELPLARHRRLPRGRALRGSRPRPDRAARGGRCAL